MGMKTRMLLRRLKLMSKKYTVLSSRRTKTPFWCREEVKAVKQKDSI